MRIDKYLTVNGYFDSRTKAEQAIERGEVYINNLKTDKPSAEINEFNINVNIEIKSPLSFVSLGGYKLKKALDDFRYSVKGKVAADVGASTGGFTDCLLQNGAKKVYAVDLNDTLLHEKLKKDERVIPIIKNARNLNAADFLENIDLLTADLSFISETLVIPIFSKILNFGSDVILLIKPQFENDKKIRLKNGIIRDEKILIGACKKVYDCAVNNGFSPLKITQAPLREDKNIEYLFLLKRGSDNIISFEKIFNENS